MDRKGRDIATDERRGLKAAEDRERSHRRGARVDPVDDRVEREKDVMRTNGKSLSALEVPQGAAVHPARTPDDATARHGTRSF